MSILEGLQQSGAIGSMARELGVDEPTAQKAAGALLPAIVAGLGRNQVGAGGSRAGSSGGGLADVLGGVLGGSGGGLLDQVLHADPTPTKPGNDILGQIFGTKDVSRGVAEAASGSTGISQDLLKKMLPILAMAVIGYMTRGKPGAGGGMLGGILGQVVTGMLRR
ncbi:DUF937 domain-containing protein [Tsuneonella rigui]|uniref:DUF937 domain-containing protein n=1 Tax=Tsuneonella rigui TaxID=1708790 RepID=UPI000F7F4E51|nr:DUF937 domain-containing protein [Tsuneonella rigui]